MATRWGICSAGKISHDFTVALKTLPAEDHQVVAVAARNLEDAEEFSRKHNISKAYGGYEELFIFNFETLQYLLFYIKLFLISREVKMVRADFGVPLLNVPRSVQKELGGGALLDLGIYCLQFINMVYNGEKPESIQASGICLETGVDETVAVNLKYSENRLATFTCSAGVQLHNDAIIGGTKGTIQVPSPMWCPTSLVVNGKETQYPVPEPYLRLNFTNSTGMRYEAEEVRQCLLKGLKESPVMSHSDSLLLIELEDEIHRQVGVVHSQDCQ
uniref:Dihydrodiol dehydrogenase, tandem duplicate 2 n=1 Tax=Xiphophorus couchianus TaxID=32473 RepID=A0A3B5M7U1_9TELE